MGKGGIIKASFPTAVKAPERITKQGFKEIINKSRKKGDFLMKKMKKVVAVLVAAAMTMALSLAAFATGGTTDPGAITVTNANVGSTYKAYKIFDLAGSDASDPADGVFDNFAYTYTKTGDSDATYAALAGTDSPFTLTESSVAGKYNVSLKDGMFAKNITTWLKTNEDKFTAVQTKDNVTSATVEFTGLPLGYYFVTSTLGKDNTGAYNDHGANVALTSTKPSATIIDKNQGPTWDNDPNPPDDPDDPVDDPTDGGKMVYGDDNKLHKANSASFGEKVKFNVAIDTTNYAGGKQVLNYFVNDKISAGFTYDTASIKIKVAGTELATTAYKVNWIDKDGNIVADPTATGAARVEAFCISIPWDKALPSTEKRYEYDEELGYWVEKAGEPLYADFSKLEVEYEAEVTDAAAIAGAGNLNTATFDYRTSGDKVPGTTPPEPDKPNDPNDPGNTPPDPNEPPTNPPGTPDDPGYHTSPPSDTTTYVFALGILKVDPVTSKKLEHAKFVLQDANGKYVTLVTDATTKKVTVKLEDNKPTGNINGVQGIFESGSDGQILVKGLREGTYSFTEVEAPDGYNLLTESKSVTVSIDDVAKYGKTYTTYYDNEGNQVKLGTSSDGTYKVELDPADGKYYKIELDAQGQPKKDDQGNVIKTGVNVVTSNYAENAAEIVVENLSGPELPTTGGIGTVIFYVVGAILVIGAGVLLITKKRMQA